MVALPEFDQQATDRRFLVELDRLYQAGTFVTYGELAQALGIELNTVAAIARGRYHCNLRLLYELRRCYPTADVDFILYGGAYAGREEPTLIPERPRGRAWGRSRPQATTIRK